MIEIEGLTKRFGRTAAVDAVSLRVAAGESVALWGANGAGKTTLIRCVLGLLRHAGRITVAGHDTRRRGKQARQAIGYVPQELGFYDDLGVGAAVRYFGSLRGVRVREVDEVLAKVKLDGHAGKRVRDLSGGMKQRLALAIALLSSPRVLVLDEVTASLDAVGRGEFVSLLATLTRSTDHATLFASHRVEEIGALATRVVTLGRGRVVSDVPVAEFVGRHGGSQVMHVFLEAGQRDAAIGVLRGGGLAARMNGRGILVPVAHGRRAAPLRILHEARIDVADFEVLDEPVTGGDA